MFVPEPTFPIEVITRSAHDEPSTFRCSPRTALGTNYRRDLRNGDHGSSNALVSNGASRHAPFVQLRSNQFDRKPVDYDKGTVESPGQLSIPCHNERRTLFWHEVRRDKQFVASWLKGSEQV